MTEGLSIVALQRIREYQQALRLNDERLIEETEEKLRALDIEPGIARHIVIRLSEITGDR